MNLEKLVHSLFLGGTLIVVPALTTLAQEAKKDAVPPKPAETTPATDNNAEKINAYLTEEKIDELVNLDRSSAVFGKMAIDLKLNNPMIEVEKKSAETETNFRELVYQLNKKPTDRKSVLVYFGSEKTLLELPERERDQYIEDMASGMNMAVVFGALAQVYNNQMTFVYFPVEKDIGYERRTWKWALFGKECTREGIRSDPSLALYASFDVVDGETSTQNDGIIKRIDWIVGAPAANSVAPCYRNLARWIKRNISEPNEEYTTRYDGGNVFSGKKVPLK